MNRMCALTRGFAFLLVMSLTLPVSAAKKSDPAKWVPKDAFLYVGVRNCDDTSKALEKTAMMRMSKDEALAEAMQPTRKLINNVKSILADELGLDSPKALEVYPEGMAAFYMTASLDESNEPAAHLALAMDMGENVDKAKELATKILDASLKRGGTKDTKEVAGKTITVVRFKDRDAAGGNASQNAAKTQKLIDRLFDGVEIQDQMKMMVSGMLSEAEMPEEFAYVFDESRLIVGSDLETTTDALKRITRDSDDTMMGSAAMRTLRKHVEKKADVHMIFNIPQVVSVVTKTNAEASQMMNAMGINTMGALVASMEFAPSKKIDTRMAAFLDLGEGERIGVPSILSMENTRTKPPANVPEDAMVYGSMNLSLAAVYQEILAIAERVDPKNVEQMRASMKMPTPDGGMIDIEKDILAHMVGPLSGMMRAEKPFDVQSFNGYFGFGHDSAEAMTTLLTKVVPPGFLSPTEMLGRTIYDVIMMPGMSLAVTDKAMLIGTRNSAENFIRNENKSDGALAGSKKFKAAAKQVPKKTCAYLYSDSYRALEAQAAIAKKGDMPVGSPPPIALGMGAMMRWGMAQSADPTLLKHIDVLKKYTPAQMFALSSESDGLRIDVVAVNVEN